MKEADGEIKCRGRNGWFVFREATVHTFHNKREEGHLTTEIHIYSRAMGPNAPIQIHGPAGKIIQVLEDIVAGIKGKMADLLDAGDGDE